MASKNKFTQEYQNLATAVNDSRKARGINKLTKSQISALQEKLVNGLLEKEESFKRLIFTFPEGNEAYYKFLDEITVVNKNILTAKPYFREVAKTFYKKITPAIKTKDIQALQEFHINYRFIKFIIDHWGNNVPTTVEKLFNEVCELRAKVIENNIPLALNRSMRFFRKVKRHHLNLMDMINISIMGLTSGVDKWVGPYRSVFLSVCIGRMTGDLIKNASETSIYFYPSDRRVIYHVNLLKSREGIEDLDRIIERLLADPDLKDLKLTRNGIIDLLSATSVVSADGPSDVDEGEEDFNVYSYTPSEVMGPEECVTNHNSYATLLNSYDGLSVLERKILRLKGIKIGE